MCEEKHTEKIQTEQFLVFYVFEQRLKSQLVHMGFLPKMFPFIPSYDIIIFRMLWGSNEQEENEEKKSSQLVLLIRFLLLSSFHFRRHSHGEREREWRKLKTKRGCRRVREMERERMRMSEWQSMLKKEKGMLRRGNRWGGCWRDELKSGKC